MGSGGTAPLFLTLAPDESGQLHAPATIPPGETATGTQCVWVGGGGLGAPQTLSGPYKEERNLLPLMGIEPQLLGSPARNLVTTELYNTYKRYMR
jgi:hypothetical protein